MWWRLVGSAVEHAADGVDFSKLFEDQEDDDEEMSSLADALALLAKMKWPKGRTTFKAAEVSAIINYEFSEMAGTLREVFAPNLAPQAMLSAKSMGRLLKKNRDAPVRHGERTLTLLSEIVDGEHSWYVRVK